MSALDWIVLGATLLAFIAYGTWRGRATRDLSGYLVASRSLRWPAVALSVMATQASAITFLSTPGQGFADGLRFVQFYFGLPFAMVVLCWTAIPAYQRLRVFTAYEFLEQRFDARTRTLAAGLFLVQRGLAAGLTIYAPALVLSVLLGWDVRWTCVLMGSLAVLSTAFGGSRAVAHAQVLQFVIILGAMALAFVLIVLALPPGVGLGDATALAGRMGKLNAIQLKFDPNDRYNLWSGLIGGFFLQLSYFGTDQSQVGRYLAGQSVRQSRIGLIANGIVKIPMQFGILFLGVMVYVFFLFAPTPLFFNPVASSRVASGAHAQEWKALEQRHRDLGARIAKFARTWVDARHRREPGVQGAAELALDAATSEDRTLRAASARVLRADDPGAQTSDTNYVFLTFVLRFLPAGVIGLVLAAMFAASMNSTSAELNALTSTTVVDVVRRLRKSADASDRPAADLTLSRWITVGWTVFAVAFAEYASRLGSLIEAVNILGSLFYGTLLGIFLTAFYLKRVGGRAVFAGAVIGETCVIACFHYTKISFLWYNLIGCAVVMLSALLLSAVWPDRPRANSVATPQNG